MSIFKNLGTRILSSIMAVALFLTTFVLPGTAQRIDQTKTEPPNRSSDRAAVLEAFKNQHQGDPVRRPALVASNSVYLRNQTVTNSGGASNDQFGLSVAISGNRAIIGAPLENSLLGAAYIYIREGESWNLEKKLVASDASGLDFHFGQSVDIDGSTVIVGAPFADIDGVTDKGAVYIYTAGGEWDDEIKIVNPCDYRCDQETGDKINGGEYFGVSVALDGDRAVVGAFMDDVLDDNSVARNGSATAFQRAGSVWSVLGREKMLPDSAAFQTNFGLSVSISGDSVFVGANNFHGSFAGQGAAYCFVFDGTDWNLQSQLLAADAAAIDFFGSSVAIEGDVAVIGSSGNTGKAYIANRSAGTWSTPSALAFPSGVTALGPNVALSGDTIVVGKPSTGYVYIYRYDGSSWSYAATITGTTIGASFIGNSVAVDGNKIISGATADGASGQGTASFYVNTTPRPFDADGDGASNVSVFRPTGSWYIDYPTTYTGTSFGDSSSPVLDKIAPADFDGDGKMDIAVFRSSTGIWYILNSSTSSVTNVSFGAGNDKPMPEDFDGDGKADVAVFRPSDHTFYWQRSSDSGNSGYQIGTSGDEPVMADFDGDGVADPAVFRQSNGTWYWFNTVTSGSGSVQFGASGDIPAPGDFDGDLKTDPAVFRPSTGVWYRLESSNNGFVATSFGTNLDIPTVGDYDADGESDISVFRPSTGIFYTMESRSGSVTYTAFGTSGDIPLAAAYAP